MHTTRNPLLICIGLLTSVVPTALLFMGMSIYFFVPLLVGLGCIAMGSFSMPRAEKRTSMGLGIFLCLAASIGPFALAAYSNRSGKPIRVVLPANYSGQFSIVKNRAAGQGLQLQQGEWAFVIPEGGVLLVNEDYPFCMWHKETFIYSDGRPVNVESLGTTAGTIKTGLGSSRGSTDYEGTTHRWKVTEVP